MSNLAKELLDKQSVLEADRSTFEHHWSQIAPLVLPRQDDFFNERRTEGERRTKEKADDTATLALDRFAAAMESVLTPRSQKWHRLTVADDRLMENKEVTTWLDNLNDLLFKTRYSTKANYASQQHETYMSLGAFGTGVLIVEDILGQGIRYKSSHISEHFFMENINGLVDTNFRKYRLTARQALEKFGDNAPPAVHKCMAKEPNKKLEFLHVVMPDVDGESGMNFVSYHVGVDDNQLITNGGFKTFPYIISRYTTSPNETYGRSPAMTALSEIKMINSMRRTDLRARHLAVDPPILAADPQTVRKFSMKPGAINYGTLDVNGNPLVRPYTSGVNIAGSNDGMDQSRQFINDTFLVTLFQILVESPAMTATEVLQRAQEKGALLAPTMGRQQSESQGPMIEREIGILEDYGIFEDDGMLPMPDALKEIGGDFEIEYTSPLSKLQRAEEALATERTVQSMIPLAQIDPSIMDKVDFSEYANIMREANGAPAKLFKSDEELQAIQQAKAQQQQQQQIIEAAPGVAGAVKDIAQAQAIE
jgi:hypothetical protein